MDFIRGIFDLGDHQFDCIYTIYININICVYIHTYTFQWLLKPPVSYPDQTQHPVSAYLAGCQTIPLLWYGYILAPLFFHSFTSRWCCRIASCTLSMCAQNTKSHTGDSCLANALALLNVKYQTPTSTCTISLKTYKCIFVRFIVYFNLVILKWCSTLDFNAQKAVEAWL